MRAKYQADKPRRRLCGAALAAVLVACSALAAMPGTARAAEKWPDKPIRIVVPFTVGGSNDVIARRLAQELTQSLGQSVVVENRGGASGVVGSAVVAHAAPDGYTYLFVSASLATSAATQDPPYDTVNAFAAVARVADAPFLMVTREQFPAKTLPEFIEYAKAHPGQINYGTTGVGDSAHLLTELFSSLSNIKMQPISYKGIGPAQVDLVAGRLDFLVTTLASIGGTPAAALPKLAFTGATRDTTFANVPTVKEATGLDYNETVWWGMFAPGGTPEPVLEKMNAEVTRIVAKPEFKRFLANLGATAAPSSRAEMAAQLKRDVTVYTQTARRGGISVAGK